ncbi:MAG: hypothetical protein N2A99_04080 [Carnobacterium alterfunditum]
MRGQFNKLGSIEVEGSTMKYRISVQDLGLDDSVELEKEIKRTLLTVSDENRFLVPFSIEVMNRYMLMYYDLRHFTSLDYLRELDLDEKIPYLLSLVDIAKEQERGLKISWERANFVCDKFEEKIKVFLFETDSIKIYETPEDILKTVKDLICSTMTILSSFITLPKRQDFIDPSEENIQFIESVYRMKNLDDLFMMLETLSLDLEQSNSYTISREEKTDKKKVSLFKKSEKKEGNQIERKPIQKKKKTPPVRHTGNAKKKKQTAEDKKMKLGFGFVGAALIIYLVSAMLLPSADGTRAKDVVTLDTSDESGFFEGTTTENNNLVEAYRMAYNSDYEESFQRLSTIEKKKLGSNDVPLLIQVYDETGNLSSLLDEVPSLANDVVTYLLTRNKLDKLTDIATGMKAKNPYIEFEKAHYNQEYEYMLTLINDVEINGRKESQIIDGYLALELADEARKFAEKVGNPDLIKRVEESKQ